MRRSLEDVKADMRWGLSRALVLACTFGLLVIVIAGIGGSAAFRAHLVVGPGEVLGVYFGSAVVGGPLIGLLRPLFTRWWGAAIGGFVGGTIGGLGMQIVWGLNSRGWGLDGTMSALIYGSTVGVAVGVAWYHRFSPSKEDGSTGGRLTRQQRRREERSGKDP